MSAPKTKKSESQDLLKYLEVDTSGLDENSLHAVRERIETDAKEFIFYKLCSELSRDQMEEILQTATSSDLLMTLQLKIPDFHNRAKKYLAEYKERLNNPDE